MVNGDSKEQLNDNPNTISTSEDYPIRTPKSENYAIGMIINVRGEDFKITKAEPYRTTIADDEKTLKNNTFWNITAVGLSNLVKYKEFCFDTAVENFYIKNPPTSESKNKNKGVKVYQPIDTEFVVDESNNLERTRLLLESSIRGGYLSTDLQNQIDIREDNSLHSSQEQIESNFKELICSNKNDTVGFDSQDYQYLPIKKALNSLNPRILIADAVGLGKTIEVGIFLSEMIKRGRGRRILICALKSVLAQFQSEMWNRFAIPFQRLDSVGIAKIRSEIPLNKNPFDYYDKVIISVDTLKNGGKFRNFVQQAHWDIVVIDECHIVTNSSSDRGALAKILSEHCDSLVLTSATPHNGKKKSIANIMSMLDPMNISLNQEPINELIPDFYVRRLKNNLPEDIRAKFGERKLSFKDIELNQLNELEREFLTLQYELRELELNVLVSDKDILIKKIKSRNIDVSKLFSIVLFKAFLSSPTAACATVTEKLKRISEEDKYTENKDFIFKLKEIKDVLDKLCNNNIDTRYDTLKEILKDKLKLNEEDTSKNQKIRERIVIFTERKTTIEMLSRRLKDDFKITDEQVKTFDGSLGDVDQQKIISDFGTSNTNTRILICSDAGATGVNLHQYCHLMVNYDLPWSLITLEQRNGRIDRYGQTNAVEIFYIFFITKEQKQAISLMKQKQGDATLSDKVDKVLDEGRESEVSNNSDNSQSENNKIQSYQTDFRIIYNLIQKEEEVHNTFGESCEDVFKVYSPEKEENIVINKMVSGDDNIDSLDWGALDLKADDNNIIANEDSNDDIDIDSLDWDALNLDAEDNNEDSNNESDVPLEVTKNEEVQDDDFAEQLTFYPKNNSDYYSALFGEVETLNGENLREEDGDKGIPTFSLTCTDYLKSLLSALPSEAFIDENPIKFILTKNNDAISKAIKDSAKVNCKSWSRLQPLIDLHPVVQILTDRFTTTVGKNSTLVAKFVLNDNAILSSDFKNYYYYIFYACLSNKRGQVVYNGYFVVKAQKEDGGLKGTQSLNSFLNDNNHFFDYDNEIFTRTSTSEELNKIHKAYPSVLENNFFGAKSFVQNLRATLSQNLRIKRENYQKNHVDIWEQKVFEELDIANTPWGKAYMQEHSCLTQDNNSDEYKKYQKDFCKALFDGESEGSQLNSDNTNGLIINVFEKLYDKYSQTDETFKAQTELENIIFGKPIKEDKVQAANNSIVKNKNKRKKLKLAYEIWSKVRKQMEEQYSLVEEKASDYLKCLAVIYQADEEK